MFSGLAWSPDGEELAFSRARQGQPHMIFLVAVGGGLPWAVPGTRDGFMPVFSPDGRTLAFTRITRREPHRFRWGTRWDFESASVWLVDLQTGESRRLTRSRDDLNHYASSFSPDGATLLTMRWDIERSQDFELVALRFDGRPSALLVGEGFLPVYSPDGSKIALSREHERSFKVRGARYVPPEFGGHRRFVTDWELYTVNADGSHLRRLTQTPGKDELFPGWDPSGERIAYAQFQRERLALPSSVMQMNADGTCPSKVLARSGTVFYGPIWQPGPGREAGRISC